MGRFNILKPVSIGGAAIWVLDQLVGEAAVGYFQSQNTAIQVVLGIVAAVVALAAWTRRSQHADDEATILEAGWLIHINSVNRGTRWIAAAAKGILAVDLEVRSLGHWVTNPQVGETKPVMSVVEAFDAAVTVGDPEGTLRGRRLAIAGQPRSGKTMALCRLAQDLDNREQPVILCDMAAWVRESKFHDFLQAYLTTLTSVGATAASEWARTGEAVFLLDGFDRAEDPEAAWESFVEFVGHAPVSFVVTGTPVTIQRMLRGRGGELVFGAVELDQMTDVQLAAQADRLAERDPSWWMLRNVRGRTDLGAFRRPSVLQRAAVVDAAPSMLNGLTSAGAIESHLDGLFLEHRDASNPGLARVAEWVSSAGASGRRVWDLSPQKAPWRARLIVANVGATLVGAIAAAGTWLETDNPTLAFATFLGAFVCMWVGVVAQASAAPSASGYRIHWIGIVAGIAVGTLLGVVVTLGGASPFGLAVGAFGGGLLGVVFGMMDPRAVLVAPTIREPYRRSLISFLLHLAVFGPVGMLIGTPRFGPLVGFAAGFGSGFASGMGEGGWFLLLNRRARKRVSRLLGLERDVLAVVERDLEEPPSVLRRSGAVIATGDGTA